MSLGRPSEEKEPLIKPMNEGEEDFTEEDNDWVDVGSESEEEKKKEDEEESEEIPPVLGEVSFKLGFETKEENFRSWHKVRTKEEIEEGEQREDEQELEDFVSIPTNLPPAEPAAETTEESLIYNELANLLTPDTLFIFLKLMIALGTAAPTAIFALLLPSGKQPSELDEKWLKEMSTFQKIASMLLGLSSLFVNAKLNLNFFKKAAEIFKNLSFKTVVDALKNLTSTVSGVGGALSAGALAFTAFETLGKVVPGMNIAFAIFNALIFFVSRLWGVDSFLGKMLNRHIDHTQLEIVDLFKRLNQQANEGVQAFVNQECERLLNPEHTTLTKEDYETLFGKLAEELLRLQQNSPDLFPEKTNGEYAAEWGGFAFDVVMGLVIGTMTAGTFDHITLKGIATLVDILTSLVEKIDGELSQDINVEQEVGDFGLLLGAIGGVPSGILYGNAVRELRQILWSMIQHLRNHPAEIPLAS